MVELHVPVCGGVEDGEAAHGGWREHVSAVVALDEAGLLRLVLRKGMQAVVHHHHCLHRRTRRCASTGVLSRIPS